MPVRNKIYLKNVWITFPLKKYIYDSFKFQDSSCIADENKIFRLSNHTVVISKRNHRQVTIWCPMSFCLTTQK